MDDTAPQTEASQPCCSRFTRMIAGAAAIFILTGGLAYALWPSSGTSTDENALDTIVPLAEFPSEKTDAVGSDTNSSSEKVDKEESEDERMARLIVGRWETQRESGHRDMVVKEDGTATIHVTIESLLGRALFGTSELDLEIEWRVENGLLHFTTTGGKPKPAIEFLKKSYGESVQYPIIECTETRLLVREGDGEPDHDWARVEE